MSLLLAALLSMQQLQSSAVVDRQDAELGQEIMLTITVEASGNLAVRIVDPILVGLEVRSTTPTTDVAVRAGILTRVVTREVRLIATRVGTARIGATRIESGNAVVVTDPIEINVSPASVAPPGALMPHVRALIERRRPVGITEDEVLVEVVTTADTIVLGDKTDVVVVAWFPRQVRSRLRNPPTLDPPQLQGAWTYTEGVPGAVAMSRQIGGEWYDIYAHHQVVFPLTPGDFEIGTATVSYSLPLTYSFLSREVLHEPQSESLSLHVMPQSTDGRPADFDGAAAAQLELRVDTEVAQLAVGDAGSVVATLSGRGNVALWPEPRIEWPQGIRVYPQPVDVALESREDGIWGTKVFRYLVVAQSRGTHSVPELVYPYFDLESAAYNRLTAPPIEIITEGNVSVIPTPRLRETLPLMEPAGFVVADRLVRAWPWWIWIVLVGMPPLALLIVRFIRRVRARSTLQPSRSSEMGQLEHQFGVAVRALVSNPESLDGSRFSEALRATGVDEPIAVHAARVRERLWQAKYGPAGEIDPAELTAEVEEILRALRGGGLTVERAGAVGFTVLLLTMVAAGSLAGQSAERLYSAGAMREAADSFLARVEVQPSTAAHWYNLGSALYSTGEETRAMAAWLRAGRLAPRHPYIGDAIELASSPDRSTRRLTWIAPVSPGEAFFIALVLWLAGWTLAGVGVRKRVLLPIVAFSVLSGAYGWYVSLRYSRPVALIVAEETGIRVAPYGSARMLRNLEQGSAVLVDRIEGHWVLVDRSGEKGWIRLHEIVQL